MFSMEKTSEKRTIVSEERYKEIQDSVKNIKDRLSSLAEKVKEEVVTLSKIGRRRLDIISLKKQRDDFYTSLGKKTHELIKEKVISVPELATLSAKIDELSEKISSLEREVGDMARKVQESRGKKEEAAGRSRLKPDKKPRKKPLGRREGDEEE